MTDIKRIPPSSVDPTIKNYHWIDLVTGMLDAYDKGHHTAILVDEDNNVIGELRSGCYNPTFKQVIGIAMINKPHFETSKSFKININTLCSIE